MILRKRCGDPFGFGCGRRAFVWARGWRVEKLKVRKQGRQELVLEPFEDFRVVTVPLCPHCLEELGRLRRENEERIAREWNDPAFVAGRLRLDKSRDELEAALAKVEEVGWAARLDVFSALCDLFLDLHVAVGYQGRGSRKPALRATEKLLRQCRDTAGTPEARESLRRLIHSRWEAPTWETTDYEANYNRAIGALLEIIGRPAPG